MKGLYGLVFRDSRDDSLNCAIFNEDKNGFVEVYPLAEEFESAYTDITSNVIIFASVSFPSPQAIGLEKIAQMDVALVDYNGKTLSSEDFITMCYDENEGARLIKDTFDTCYSLSFSDNDTSLVDINRVKLDS